METKTESRCITIHNLIHSPAQTQTQTQGAAASFVDLCISHLASSALAARPLQFPSTAPIIIKLYQTHKRRRLNQLANAVAVAVAADSSQAETNEFICQIHREDTARGSQTRRLEVQLQLPFELNCSPSSGSCKRLSGPIKLGNMFGRIKNRFRIVKVEGGGSPNWIKMFEVCNMKGM